MITFLLIGLTVQRSLPTDEDNDSLDFLSDDIALGAKDSGFRWAGKITPSA